MKNSSFFSQLCCFFKCDNFFISDTDDWKSALVFPKVCEEKKYFFSFSFIFFLFPFILTDIFYFQGDWLWPAIWLLPRLNAYGDWPASGEIDIVESRGNGNGYPGGVDSFGITLHWGPFYPQDGWSKTLATYQLNSGDFSQDFHVFGLVWNQNQLYTYVDSQSQVSSNFILSLLNL